MKYERAPLDNPAYEAKGDWMYYPEGFWTKSDLFKMNYPTWNKEEFTIMSDGHKVIYKFHICLALEEYLPYSRKIVLNFLHKNKIMHKMAADKPALGRSSIFTDVISNESDTQYGKTITVYTGTLEEFYIIAKGMQQLVKKYSINGIPRSKFMEVNANMQYELPVPGTNNALYYTVEMATYDAVYEAIRYQHPEWITKDDLDSWGNQMMLLTMPNGTVGQVGIGIAEAKSTSGSLYRVDGTPAFYLSSRDGSGYALREPVMRHYWGEGPIDFLWDSPP